MPDTAPQEFNTKNLILNNLKPEELSSLRPSFEYVDVPAGKELHTPDSPNDYIYFPNESVVAVVATTETGQSAMVAIIGNEGVVGVEGLMGANSSPHAIISLYGDGAIRIKLSDIEEQFNQCGNLHSLLLRFTQKLMVQIGQKALCNRLHSLEQRFARWLLMYADRIPTNQVHITQEFLAEMLGSTRASVTLTAIEMQNQGLITYSRGNITILDRKGIEAISCDCYATIKQAYEESVTL
jgi:CRP-like cAMP-binding protein